MVALSRAFPTIGITLQTTMKDSFLSSEGRIGRLVFIVRLFLLIALVASITGAALRFFEHWHHGAHMPLGYFVGLVAALICTFIVLMQLIKRLHDMGKPVALAILLLLPGVNVLLLLYAAVMPAKS